MQNRPATLLFTVAALLSTVCAILPVQRTLAFTPLAPQAISGVLASRGLTDIRGSVLPELRYSIPVHALDSHRVITVSVHLKIRHSSALSKELRDLYDPQSARYHRFLTVDQFSAAFAPKKAEVHRLSRFLSTYGLAVGSLSRNGLLMTARGTVQHLESAFGTHLFAYRHRQKNFYANSSPVRLPGDLAATISAVSGLTDGARQHVNSQRPRWISHAQSPVYGHNPEDFARIYNLSGLYARGINGSGQTIAIVSHADFTDANVATYNRQFGLASTVERVSVAGGAELGPGQDEAEADVEIVQGMAPKAHILVYEAPNSSDGALALYNRIVSDRRANVVTTSWGTWETANPPDDVMALHQVLEEAAVQGQAVFAASGDNGAFDQAQDPSSGDPTALSVDFPASDPWVTGVGGTSLHGDSTTYGGETVWSDGSDTSKPIGSGGGLSALFPRPDFQAGPGVLSSYSNGMRQVPDVAADADGSSGYSIYTIDSRNHPGWGEFGGTSASTPLWASFAVLLNQAAGKTFGSLNPTLYYLGQHASSFAHSPFHDITDGTNLKYPATPGWDFATGWGSFDGQALVDAAKSIGTGTVLASPTATSTVSDTGRTPTALPTETASPTPEATPRTSPTAIPVLGSIHIDGVVILRKVKGKLTPVSILRLNQAATFAVLYHQNGPGLPFARVVITKNGHGLDAIPLQRFLYHGGTAFGTKLTFVDRKASGKLFAHFTIALGVATSTRHRKFTVLAKP